MEEIELTPDEFYWKVTLGWPDDALELAYRHMMPEILKGFKKELPRVYKVFKVEAETGHVASMSIREI